MRALVDVHLGVAHSQGWLAVAVVHPELCNAAHSAVLLTGHQVEAHRARLLVQGHVRVVQELLSAAGVGSVSVIAGLSAVRLLEVLIVLEKG